MPDQDIWNIRKGKARLVCTCPCEGDDIEKEKLLGNGKTRAEALVDLGLKLCAHAESCTSPCVSHEVKQDSESATRADDVTAMTKCSVSDCASQLKKLSGALAGVSQDKRQWDAYLWSSTRISLGAPPENVLLEKGFV